MKRWLTHFVIAAYLSALSAGIVSHAIGYGTGAHPGMYFLVWDMFCGWSAYASRLEVIGEGESGRYYQLAPGPWGEMRPFGHLGRRHYDLFCKHAVSLGVNTLKHTDHEPMTRIIVVETCWAKKYNLPDSIWQERFDEPKEFKKYHKIRRIALSDGTLTHRYQAWYADQYRLSVIDNPRLRRDVNRNRPFFTFGGNPNSQGAIVPGSFYDRLSNAPVGMRLGE